MLKPCAHQASGLQRLAQAAVPRLLAMVSHHDPKAERATLMSLCAAWHQLNYRVVILDGMAPEEPGAGGLLDLVNEIRPSDDTSPDTGTNPYGWTVVAASKGLQHLATPLESGQGLADWLRQYDVVVIYAPSDLLVHAIGTHDAETLLAISPEATSILTAYQSMKTLLQSSRLHPLMVTPVHANDYEAHTLERLNHTLQSCVAQFLGQKLPVLTVHTLCRGEAISPDMVGLALRLLEKAPLLMPAAPAASSRIGPREQSSVMERSH